MIFYKISPDFQLGHLYEHIFLNQFILRLRRAGFLAFLDYEIFGESYNDGVVKIIFNGFSAEVKNFFEENFLEFSPDFSEREIEVAISQICCEKGWRFEGFCGDFLAELNNLSAQEWQEFSYHPEEKIKTISDFLLFSKDDNLERCEFAIFAPKNVNHEAFFLLSKIIINSLSEDFEYYGECFTTGVKEVSDEERHISKVFFTLKNKITNIDIGGILNLIIERKSDVLAMLSLAKIKFVEEDFDEIIEVLRIE